MSPGWTRRASMTKNIVAVAIAALLAASSASSADATKIKAMPAQALRGKKALPAPKHRPRGKRFHGAVRAKFRAILKARVAKVKARYEKMLKDLRAQLKALQS